MKSVFFILSIAGSMAFADAEFKCVESPTSRDITKRGFITVETSSAGCHKSGSDEKCSIQTDYNKDYCVDSTHVMKMNCEQGVPVTVSKDCPQGKHCKSGACIQ